MFGLDKVAHIATSNIVGDLPLHVVPPENLLEVLVHFGTTRVDGVSRAVGFFKNLLFKRGLVWHIDESTKMKYPLLIHGETGSLSQCNLGFNLLNTVVSLLCLLDICFKIGLDF